jgi:hypothetical protein
LTGMCFAAFSFAMVQYIITFFTAIISIIINDSNGGVRIFGGLARKQDICGHGE